MLALSLSLSLAAWANVEAKRPTLKILFFRSSFVLYSYFLRRASYYRRFNKFRSLRCSAGQEYASLLDWPDLKRSVVRKLPCFLRVKMLLLLLLLLFAVSARCGFRVGNFRNKCGRCIRPSVCVAEHHEHLGKKGF